MFIILSTFEIVCFYFTALTSLYVNYKSIQPFAVVKKCYTYLHSITPFQYEFITIV